LASRILHAGHLTARYSDGSLRGISLDGHEVLRQVVVALRDYAWKTIPYRLSREKVTEHGDRFVVELTAEHITSEVDFLWNGVIEGRADGTIRWTMSGEARRQFSRNRIGFCVLHPIAMCAGAVCLVEHPDGRGEHLSFPARIAPHQPFVNIAAMSYEIRPGLLAELRFSGDVFETEDHRNWTDYSFKTYSTPLSLPRPVTVQPGEHIEQAVELRLRPVSSELRVDWVNRVPFPEIDTRRIDVRFGGSDEALAETISMDAPVEVAFFTDHPAKDLPPLVSRLGRLNIRRYLIFSAAGDVTTVDGAKEAREILGGSIPIGGGANTSFAEWNRNREAAELLDFVSWPINPRAHAEDPETMVENLEGQQATVESARILAPGKLLRISPVYVPPIPASEGWLAASVSRLGQAGVASVVFSERHPLVDEILGFAPEHLCPVWSSDPLKCYALALQSKGQTRVWVVNFTDEPQTVSFDGTELLLSPFESRRI
jgi:hypothetical protein